MDAAEQRELEEHSHAVMLSLVAIAILLGDEFPILISALEALEAHGGQDTGSMSFRCPETGDLVRRCLDAVDRPSPADLRRHAARVARCSFHHGFSA